MYTNVAETFKDGTILITGSTGFLGKLLLEKLLRSCPLKAAAVLVRSKKGYTAAQRARDSYKNPLFDKLRVQDPDFMSQIKIVDGNIEESSMGLSSEDRQWLIENVNFIFHCAATVRFNEPLELATKINIQGTSYLLTLAAEMKNLKGFVHVSTAYSHCPRNEIREQYYPVPITAIELKNISDIDQLSLSKILNKWPNTYCFTKAVTENMILLNEHKLPISVFRPSIIGCTNSEPNPGWLENMNGPSGIVTGVIIGFLRTLAIVENNITDIVPADYSVNALISVMWDTVNRYNDPYQITEEPKIYNFVSSIESPLTWGKFIEEMQKTYYEAPPLQSKWYIYYITYTNFWVGKLLKFLLHRIPAAFIDLLLMLCLKSPKMLNIYTKMENIIDTQHMFTTKEWVFGNTNTRHLWALLNQEDRNTFFYSLENFDWKSYIKNYYYGIREHILHENLSNKTEALGKNRKLFWLHQLCIVLFFFPCITNMFDIYIIYIIFK